MIPAIPRRLAHIWIGERPPPLHWMQTWRDHHPDWEYRLYDNAYLTGRRWRNQRLMAEYFRRGRLEGVADLMRYELLFETGGFIPGADFEALRPCDALFAKPVTYSCYETHPKGRCRIVPWLASAPGTLTLAMTIDEIHEAYAEDPTQAEQPWMSVGNLFLRGFMERNREVVGDCRILPAYTFIPRHKDGPRYEGPGQVYAEHHWGTTKDRYAPEDAARSGMTKAEVQATLEATLPLELAQDPEKEVISC